MSDFFHFFNYFLARKNYQKSSQMSVVLLLLLLLFFKLSVSSRVKGKLSILIFVLI